MGMRMGNNNATSTAKKAGMRNGRNRKVYSTFYVHAGRTNGNSSIICAPLRLSKADGTYTHRQGSDLIKWTNDAGTATYVFSFRDATSNIHHVESGTHLLTFSKGRRIT